jgi:hypothetical protein
LRPPLSAQVIVLAFIACSCLVQPSQAQLSQPAPAISSVSADSPTAEVSVPPTPEQSAIHPFGAQLTLADRFTLEARSTFGAAAFAVPAGQAGLTMLFPPHRYPRNWSDGPAAFGRNYGAELARHTTGGLTHFATAAILREDPRYYASSSANPFSRLGHALAFTLVDRSDSGRRTIAVSNLSGAAAGGFIGMAFYPDGFNDTTHAYQHAALEMTTFTAHNLVAEFSPEISQLLHKFHFPDRLADSFLPPDRKQP